jgi:hypothetical protein
MLLVLADLRRAKIEPPMRDSHRTAPVAGSSAYAYVSPEPT